MSGISIEFVLGLIALILLGFAGWDYFRSNRAWSLRAKIWMRMAVIFAAIAVYLAMT